MSILIGKIKGNDMWIIISLGLFVMLLMSMRETERVQGQLDELR